MTTPVATCHKLTHTSGGGGGRGWAVVFYGGAVVQVELVRVANSGTWGQQLETFSFHFCLFDFWLFAVG